MYEFPNNEYVTPFDMLL